MGRATAALIDRELVGAFGDEPGDHLPVFAEQAEDDLARRYEQLARREEEAVAVEERLRAWSDHLRTWEGELEVRERRVEVAANLAAQPTAWKPGSGETSDVRVGRGSSTSTATACQAVDNEGRQLMDC